jgi:hypothetical protein
VHFLIVNRTTPVPHSRNFCLTFICLPGESRGGGKQRPHPHTYSQHKWLCVLCSSPEMHALNLQAQLWELRPHSYCLEGGPGHNFHHHSELHTSLRSSQLRLLRMEPKPVHLSAPATAEAPFVVKLLDETLALTSTLSRLRDETPALTSTLSRLLDETPAPSSTLSSCWTKPWHCLQH